MTQVSNAGRIALINTGTNRQGSTIPTWTGPAVVLELQREGLIGDGRGLTRKGTIERTRLMDQAESLLEF